MARLPKVALALAASTTVLAATAACGASGASGSDEVTIRFADTLPESHFISQDHSQRFIATAEKLAKEEGHELKIEFFPDSQLGDAPDQIDNMTNGVFDMALIAPSYGPDQMPAGDVFNLPHIADSAEASALAYYDLMMDEGSELRSRDFDDNGLQPLSAFALPLYQIALTSEIDGIDSMESKKIRSGGGTQNATIEALGGTPVTLTTSEQYEGLQRGVIDGGIFNTPSMIDNKTAEVLKSFTTNADVAGFVGGLAISQSSWEELPQWAKDVLLEAGEDATDHFAGLVDELGKDAQQTLVDEYGLTAVELTDDQLDELQTRLSPLKEDWVNQSDGDFDRAAVLKAAQDAADSAG